jgi:hypothetical protein
MIYILKYEDKFYTNLLPLNLPTDTSLYSCISTRCPASGWSKYEHEPGPSIEGDLICPNVFPDLILRTRESMVMLHTNEKILFNYFYWNIINIKVRLAVKLLASKNILFENNFYVILTTSWSSSLRTRLRNQRLRVQILVVIMGFCDE